MPINYNRPNVYQYGKSWTRSARIPHPIYTCGIAYTLRLLWTQTRIDPSQHVGKWKPHLSSIFPIKFIYRRLSLAFHMYPRMAYIRKRSTDNTRQTKPSHSILIQPILYGHGYLSPEIANPETCSAATLTLAPAFHSIVNSVGKQCLSIREGSIETLYTVRTITHAYNNS